jgi:hypothetical protein
MSLEENVMHLIAAIDRLALAINTTKQPVQGEVVPGKSVVSGTIQGTQIASVEKAPAEETSTSASPSNVGKSSSGTTNASVADAAAPSASGESIGAIDYDRDIFPRVKAAVAAKGRDAVVKLIEQYKPGAKKLSEAIGPAQYAEVIVKLDAMIGS